MNQPETNTAYLYSNKIKNFKNIYESKFSQGQIQKEYKGRTSSVRGNP